MVRKFIRNLPIFAGLADCNSSDYKKASVDVATNFTLSTMPIWLGTYITMALTENTSVKDLPFLSGLLSALVENISNGELFLFATATLGPIVYIAYGDIEGGNKFPTKLSHGIFVIIIVIFSACSFGLERANLDMNEGFTFPASIILFVCSWLLLSLATVYKRQSYPSPSGEFKKVEREFSEELNDHRSKL